MIVATQPQRVAFHTLGCKLNFAETAMIARKFTDNGFRKVSFDTDADIYVINTCSVTQVADKKCRQAIKKATGKGAKVVVIGCYSQLKPNEIAAIEGVDLVLGTKEKFNVYEHVKSIINGQPANIFTTDIGCATEFNASYSTTDRTRAFLKVQDGCDYHCSYCTIPLARGNSRNESVAATVQKAQEIARNGQKEIVLTGVNIGDFGQNQGESFLQLITALDRVEGINRYRISSIEPNLVNPEIIEFVKNSERFVPHFHIPLQSGSNKILTLMKRRYKRELYLERVELIKKTMPNACIGGDVIVGFPGETDDDFFETFSFLKNIDLSYLHVFPYSERNNTPAALFEGKVEHAIKDRRCKTLIELSEQKRLTFYKQHVGTTETALFESKIIKGKMHGFTRNYIKVEALPMKELFGSVVPVKLLNINNNGNVDASIEQLNN